MSRKLGVREDYLNSKHTRNSTNCKNIDYNCGGFATGTYSWLCPYPANWEDSNGSEERDDLIYDYNDSGYSDMEIANEILDYDIDYFKDLFGDKFREATKEEILEEPDGLIAYRIASENIYDEGGEFHFRVRKNGSWFEKMGISEIVNLGNIDIQEPWTYNYYTYNSKIAFFFIDN